MSMPCACLNTLQAIMANRNRIRTGAMRFMACLSMAGWYGSTVMRHACTAQPIATDCMFDGSKAAKQGIKWVSIGQPDLVNAEALPILTACFKEEPYAGRLCAR